MEKEHKNGLTVGAIVDLTKTMNETDTAFTNGPTAKDMMVFGRTAIKMDKESLLTLWECLEMECLNKEKGSVGWAKHMKMLNKKNLNKVQLNPE
jgi:hypothetical protein